MQNGQTRLGTTCAAATMGVAALFLPFTFSTSPADVISGWLQAGGSDSLGVGTLWPIALPFFLALPIALVSFCAGRLGRAAGTIAGAAWIAAALGGALPVSLLVRELLHELPSQAGEWLALGAFPTVLASGAILLLRRHPVRNIGVARSVMAMQVAYLANALFCLIDFAPHWETGAWCAATTGLLYGVQLAKGQVVTGRPRLAASGRPVRSALLAILITLSVAASLSAQPAAPPADWTAVRNVPVGEEIVVVTTFGSEREYRMAFADDSVIVMARPFRRMGAKVLVAMRRVGANWPAVLGGRAIVYDGVRISSLSVEDGTSLVASLEVVPRDAVLAVLTTRPATTADALLGIAGIGAFFAASRSVSSYDLEAQRRYDAVPGNPPLSANSVPARLASRWHVVYQAPAGSADGLSEEGWRRLLGGLPTALRGSRQ